MSKDLKLGDQVIVNHTNYRLYKQSGHIIWISEDKILLKVQIKNIELTIPTKYVKEVE